MSNFTKFMKENKTKKEYIKYAPTKTLCDENEQPLQWTLKAVTTKEERLINDACLIEKPIKNNPTSYTATVSIKDYMAKFICASVVEPDLNNKELQDSYGVMGAEDLLVEMIDNPDEYEKLFNFVKEYSSIVSLDEKVKQAKN